MHSRAIPSPEAARSIWGACVNRADSLEGLRKLARERPEDWPEIIWRCTPSVKKTVKDPHLAVLLRTTANVRCMPTSTLSSGTLRPRRAAAARAIAYARRTRVSAVDDEWLLEFEVVLATSIPGGRAAPLGDAAVKQTVSLVRRLVIDFRTARGLDVRLTSSPAGLPRSQRRRARRTPSPQILSWLLAELSADERAIVGLIVSGNLREGSVLTLRELDLDFVSGLIVPAPGMVPGRPRQLTARYGYLTGWARDLVLGHRPELLSRPRTALLFPNRNDPMRPRTTVNPALRRACERLFGPAGPRYTTEDLRRLYQAVGRAHDLPSTIVRGTSSMDQDIRSGQLRLPREAVYAEQLALRWDELCGAAAWRLAPVPRRSPEGTAPLDPEPLSGRRERLELPARAQPAGPPPSPPPSEATTVPHRPSKYPPARRASRWGRTAESLRTAASRERFLSPAALAETAPQPQRDHGSTNQTASRDSAADGLVDELRDQLAAVSRREQAMNAEIESLKREVRDLARLARSSRQPAPPGVGDLLVTAGLAAVAVKTWDHREEFVEALDGLLTESEDEASARADGDEPPSGRTSTQAPRTGSHADTWSVPEHLMQYTYVDFSSGDDLG